MGGEHEQAVSINEAVATLSDPARRAEYDRVRKLVDHERNPNVRPTSTAADDEATEPSKQRPSCAFCLTPCSNAEMAWQEGECSTCGSPLFPAEKHRDGEDSRRAVSRVPRGSPATFWLRASDRNHESGTTGNISLNGVRLVSRSEVLLGARVRLECDFCSAVCVVKSSRQDSRASGAQWHSGLEFLTLRIKRERGGLFSTVG